MSENDSTDMEEISEVQQDRVGEREETNGVTESLDSERETRDIELLSPENFEVSVPSSLDNPPFFMVKNTSKTFKAFYIDDHSNDRIVFGMIKGYVMPGEEKKVEFHAIFSLLITDFDTFTVFYKDVEENKQMNRAWFEVNSQSFVQKIKYTNMGVDVLPLVLEFSAQTDTKTIAMKNKTDGRIQFRVERNTDMRLLFSSTGGWIRAGEEVETAVDIRNVEGGLPSHDTITIIFFTDDEQEEYSVTISVRYLFAVK